MQRIVTLLFLCAFSVAHAEPPAVVPRGHAHNDYVHALDQGFASVEADIFLVDGALLVAHNIKDVAPERTLERLYLEPLRDRVAAQGGKVQPGLDRFILLVDFKSDGEATYQALKPVLEKYQDMLAGIVDGKPKPGPVMVVLSGSYPWETAAAEGTRLVALDGRPQHLGNDYPRDLVPLISDSWQNHFTWNGSGTMPEDQRVMLRDLVARVHAEGRMLRFWGTPNKTELWAEEIAAGVDLINADNLVQLHEFLEQTTKATTTGVGQ